MRLWARAGATLLLTLPLVSIGAGAAWSAGETATVTIVHGLPRFTADVYVNGRLVLDGFRPESAAGPLPLPPGSYDLAIRDVGADPTSTPVVQATATLLAGERYTVVAHLTATGKRVLTIFREEVPALPAGRSRLTVRDLAAAPPVDLLLDGGVLFRGLRSSREATSTAAPGRHSVEVRAAAGTDRLVRPTPLTLQEGTTRVLYVVGSASEGTLDFVSQDLEGAAAPSGGVPNIPAGSGGLAGVGVPRWAVASAAVGLAGLVASWAAIRRRSATVLVLALAASLLLLAAVPAGWAGNRPADAGVVPPSGHPGGTAAAEPGTAAWSGPAPRARAAPASWSRVASAPWSRAASAPWARAVPVRSARLADQATRRGPVPVALRIEAAGVDASVVPVGMDPRSNGVSIPADVGTVGWYRFGPAPGQAGSSLLVGHVDSAEQGAGAFFRLSRLQPGVPILVAFSDGSTARFTVVARRWYPKGRLPGRVFDRSGPPVLTLVTCGGAFDRATRRYADNVVIYAVPSAPAAGSGARPDHGG